MNHQDKISEYKRVKGLLVNPYPKGTIKITSQEGYLHASVKAQITHYLLSAGWEVYSEANLKGNLGRCDLIAINNESAVVIEIANSESKKSMENKEEKYPFPVIFVDASKFKYEEFKL